MANLFQVTGYAICLRCPKCDPDALIHMFKLTKGDRFVTRSWLTQFVFVNNIYFVYCLFFLGCPICSKLKNILCEELEIP